MRYIGSIVNQIWRPGGWAMEGWWNTGGGETFVQIARCLDTSGNEDFIGVTRTGGILFSKHLAGSAADPTWRPFGDVKLTAGNPGFVTSADIASDPFLEQ